MYKYNNKVIRLAKNNNYHFATKVVLLLIRLKIRFSKTLLTPYLFNKTTLVAHGYNPIFQTLLPYFQIFKYRYSVEYYR